MRTTSLLLVAAITATGCRTGRATATAAAPAQVLVESSVVTGTASEVAAYLGTAAPTDGRTWRVVPEAQAPRLDGPAAGAQGVKPLALPSFVNGSGEEATIEVSDQPQGAPWSGVRADASARVAADGSGLVVDYAAVRRAAASGRAPQQADQRAEATGVTLHAGEVLVLVSPPDAEGRQTAALVRTTVLPAR